MVKKALIKLRNKPKKPVRKSSVMRELDLSYGISLDSVVEWAKGWEANLSKVDIEVDTEDEYYGHTFAKAYAKVKTKETDKEFAERLEGYEKSLDKYNSWYKNHKQAILKELARREEEAIKKVAKDEEKAIKQLDKERLTLEKKLKNIRKQIEGQEDD